jgi:hypothetical protein
MCRAKPVAYPSVSRDDAPVVNVSPALVPSVLRSASQRARYVATIAGIVRSAAVIPPNWPRDRLDQRVD